MNKNDVLRGAFAGLLHDIGKFRQRTGMPLSEKDRDLYCPKTKTGGNSHLHAGHTGAFLYEIKSKENVFDSTTIDASARHHLANLGTEPSAFLDRMVQLADWLASGMDRDDFKKYQEGSGEKESATKLEGNNDKEKIQGNYITARLIDIFSQVYLEDKTKGEHNQKLVPLAKLSPDIKPIDFDNKRTVDQAKMEYTHLWAEFEQDFIKCCEGEQKTWLSNAFLLKVKDLLSRYTWCMPASAYKTAPEISLYDHLNLTGALTACFTATEEPTQLQDYNKKDFGEKESLLFVQGDFTGIQQFIFDFQGDSKKHAAKILRGKSFFVQMAVKTAAYALCDAFEMPYINIILDAGGKFTAILPNLKDAQDRINALEKSINQIFDEQTFGETAFFLGSTPVKPAELQMGLKENGITSISKIFKKVNVDLSKKRYTPKIEKPFYENYLKDLVAIRNGLTELDNENNDDEAMFKKTGICVLCGKHPIAMKDFVISNDGYCQYCKMYTKIGGDLTRNSFIKLGKENNGTYPCVGDYRLSFFDAAPSNEKEYVFQYGQNNATRKPNIAYLTMANFIPTDHENAAISFEDIAKKSRVEGAGKTYLVVIKADVDNLGSLFLKGFGANNNLSKYATLSRMMDHFFTQWLQSYIQDKYQNTYTVFAGGDDLFLIGPWKETLRLAKDIHTHFKTFVGENKDLTFSAGLPFFSPSKPVRQMGPIAEEFLGHAKSGGKNAVCLLDYVLTWPDYAEAINYSEKLKSFYDKGIFSSSLIYRMMTIAKMAEDFNAHKNLTINATWHAKLYYAIERNISEKNNSKVKKDIFQEIAEMLQHRPKVFIVACHDLFYQIRK